MVSVVVLVVVSVMMMMIRSSVMVIVVELLMLLLVSTGRSTSSNANGSLCRCGRSSSCSAVRTGLGDMRMSCFRRRRPDERRFLKLNKNKITK